MTTDTDYGSASQTDGAGGGMSGFLVLWGPLILVVLLVLVYRGGGDGDAVGTAAAPAPAAAEQGGDHGTPDEDGAPGRDASAAATVDVAAAGEEPLVETLEQAFEAAGLAMPGAGAAPEAAPPQGSPQDVVPGPGRGARMGMGTSPPGPQPGMGPGMRGYGMYPPPGMQPPPYYYGYGAYPPPPVGYMPYYPAPYYGYQPMIGDGGYPPPEPEPEE